MLFILRSNLFFKRKESQLPFSGNQHMKKKFYKNNVGFIIFIALVYPAIMRKSCLRCEKNLNKCRKNYEERNWDIYFTEGIRFLI